MVLFKIIGAIIFFEFLSLLAFFHPGLQTMIFFLICLGVLLVSLIDLRYGVLIALAELFIGGFGYLFVLPTGGLNLSVRMGLFLVVMSATLVKIFKDREIEFFKSKFFTFYFLLFTFLLLGLVIGYWRGNNLVYIFFDANSFFFLGYLLAFYQAFKSRDDLRFIWPVFWAAGLWLALKTLLVFFLFSHGFTSIIPWLYQWIRDARLGEITPAPGGFYRVFFQSQIYLVMGLVILAAKKVAGRGGRLFFAVIFFSAIILSFSRSFWVGLVAVLFLLFGLAVVFLRVSGRQAFRSAVWTLGVGLGGFLLVLLLSYFPYPTRVSFSLTGLLGQRISASDAAAATRWAELGPLWSAIKEHWLLGSGFGAAVTFKTQDPRVLAVSPTGEHTTYAFEWGWLDIWLKIGILGALAYLFLLWKIFKLGWKNIKYLISNIQYLGESKLMFGLLMTLVVLMIVHLFTPYLNHPLGLGWMILVGLWVDRK